ncbi:MAG: hypothetical protein ACKVP5_12140 [Aestuariivirga sp.]
MRRSPVIFVVCSVRPRSGKSLLARVLVDYLLLDGHDPFVIDAGDSGHALRPYFPGRTAAVDYGQTLGRMKIFDTIMAGPGRDYVIDLAASATASFFEFAAELDFMTEARSAGFRTVAVCFGAAGPDPFAGLQRSTGADLFVAAASGKRALVEDAMQFPELDEETAEAIASRRVSLRAFLLGDESAVPEPSRGPLKAFLFQAMSALREIELALSRKKLRA